MTLSELKALAEFEKKYPGPEWIDPDDVLLMIEALGAAQRMRKELLAWTTGAEVVLAFDAAMAKLEGK